MTDASFEMIASGRCLVARVGGVMDYETDLVLRPQFMDLIGQSDRFMVLDLSQVSFATRLG